MAKGQLIFGTLVKPTGATYPIVDTNDVKGGRHFVGSTAERNNIPASHRIAGMVVYVGGSVKKDFILKAGAPTTGPTTDANWEEYAPGTPAGGFITSHQKVEDMEYQVPYDAGKNKLTQKLDDIDSALSSKLEQHQKLEDILYQTPPTIDGRTITTLKQKLDDIDSKITSAGADKHIEDLNYLNTPSDLHGHQTNLADELEAMWATMNDPTKIMVTNYDSTKSSLQAKISALENAVPYATQIQMSSSDATKITSFLTNDSNAINTILYGPGMTLKAKIDSIASAAGSVSVETIHWSSVPASVAGGLARDADLSDELNNLFNKIKDQNDPTKITIPASVTGGSADTLNGFLTTLKGMITSAGAQTIEQIQWNSTPSGSNRNQQLGTELNTLFTAIADMNDPTKINIPASVTGTAGTLIQILTAMNGSITTNANNISSVQTSLSSLQTSVNNITNGSTTLPVPQILLFNTSAVAEGALETQEFLTNNNMKINEITVYTNSGATLSGTIQINLESSVGAGTYSTISGTSVSLTTSDSGKIKTSDLSGSSITVAANTRIRMNVVSLGGSSPELLNVRVILVPNI